MKDPEQIERAKNKHWIGLGCIMLIIGILISMYIFRTFETAERYYLGMTILGVFVVIAALLLDIGNYYDIEDEDEVEAEARKTDFIILISLTVIVAMFGLFILSSVGWLSWDEIDDPPTLEVTDWDVDVHPRKFLMMDDNGSWSYEYEFNFDVWVYSESNTGGYPGTWIGIHYVVNNKTIERESIHISESERGSADHHQKRLITNYRVTDGDDVKIILEFPRYSFVWVDGADITRHSWVIVYDVDVGTE